MDDLEFRRKIYADPKAKDDEIIAALAQDPAKKKFAHELDALDEKLLSAMKVPVPEDLCDKLILGQTFASHQQQKKSKRVHYALAASVAAIFGITISFLQFSHSYDSVGDYAIAHTNHEAQYFTNTTPANVTLASLNDKMAAFGGKFDESIGELMMADYCRFDGMKSLHIVMRGESSPVNIFVVPNSKHLSFSESFSQGDLRGSANLYRNSKIIIVSDKNESIETLQNKVNSKLSWSI